jgi:pyruvate/oxaloacetate carboxyltransferase
LWSSARREKGADYLPSGGLAAAGPRGGAQRDRRHATSEEDVISYALFPEIAKDFFLSRDGRTERQ